MEAIARMPGVFCSDFHQCMFGLITKVGKEPTLKPTRFMSNVTTIRLKFDGAFCKGHHKHRALEGSEGGEKRSRHAQRYPPELCQAFAQAVADHLRRI